MKFDFIVGNPPYQETQEATSDKPIYHMFMDEAYGICDKVCLISPARFLFNAGKTPKAWNKKMLSDAHLKVMFYEQVSAKVFPNTDIKGGVAITYRDEQEDYGCIEHFVPNETLRGILEKVKNNRAFSRFSVIVNATEYFKISDSLYKAHPELLNMKVEVKGEIVPLVSKGHENDLTSNILDKNQIVFFSEKPNDGDEYCKVYGREKGQRVSRYVKRSFLQHPEALDMYKIVVPESNNNGTFGETLVDPFVADEGSATTQTYITIGGFETRKEADNALVYIKGKFARAMLGTLKITQHNKRDTWANVPLQDFKETSDIDWSESISEIDAQLYKKYGLSKNEIEFIETHVKEME